MSMMSWKASGMFLATKKIFLTWKIVKVMMITSENEDFLDPQTGENMTRSKRVKINLMTTFFYSMPTD